MPMALRTQLFEFHVVHGKLTEFSGFEMPLWYSSIIDEHMAVRNSAGLFDVSHMGRVRITGPAASSFLSHLLPTNCTKVLEGRAFYSTICNDAGGIVDDVIVNKISINEYYMVINASNRQKDLSWLQRKSEKYDVDLSDISNTTALVALQGPLSANLLQKIGLKDVSEIKRFSFKGAKLFDRDCLISRTGYTGEDGFELTLYDTTNSDHQTALNVWSDLLSMGKESGVLPCGLGARDSLRLEAGMCLYGQDIDETTTPVEAALESVVNLDEREFIGRKRIESQIKYGASKKRVAFSMLDMGIPRHGYNVMFSGKSVGTVTSGSFSPILKRGIGLAYLQTPISTLGQKIAVQIRSSEKPAEVVGIPFYDMKRYGYRRKT